MLQFGLPNTCSKAFPKCPSRPVATALVLTFCPLQPRRESALPGGSAAKVSEPRSQNQINLAKAGRVLRRPSGRADSWEFVAAGVAFFWLLFLARQEK